MRLWRFISSHSDISLTRVVTVATLSGLSNAALLAIINSAAHSVSADGANARLFLMYALAIISYILTAALPPADREHRGRRSFRLRVNLADKIRHADLQSLNTSAAA